MNRTVFLHPLADKPTSNPDGFSAVEDERLAIAVRRHLFNFERAAAELANGARDATVCRRRWCELDLAACIGFAERAPLPSPPEFFNAMPSEFNIFHNNLSDQMASIFSGVRAELPSMNHDNDGNDDEDGEVCKPPCGTTVAAPPSQIRNGDTGKELASPPSKPRTALVKAAAPPAPAAPTHTELPATASRCRGLGVDAAGRGCGAKRGGYGSKGGVKRGSGDTDSDDDEVEDDFRSARAMLKGRSAAASGQPVRAAVALLAAAPGPVPAARLATTAAPAAPATLAMPVEAPPSSSSGGGGRQDKEETSDEPPPSPAAAAVAAAASKDVAGMRFVSGAGDGLISRSKGGLRLRLQAVAVDGPSLDAPISVASELPVPCDAAECATRAARVSVLKAYLRGEVPPPPAELVPPVDEPVELYDPKLAALPPIPALPPLPEHPAPEGPNALSVVRLGLPDDLSALPSLVSAALELRPFADESGAPMATGPAAPALLGLQLCTATSAATADFASAQPCLLLLLRGRHESVAESLVAMVAAGATAADVETVDSRLSPSLLPFVCKSVSAAPIPLSAATAAEGELERLEAALDLAAPPPAVVKSVLVLKGHALLEGRAAPIVSSLAAHGLTLLGVRLIYLPAALGAESQLGLDTPLAPGRCLVLLLEGHAAYDNLQAVIGPPDPKLARRTDPGSIRAKWGTDRAANVGATPRHAKGAARSARWFFGNRGPPTARPVVRLALGLRARLTSVLCAVGIEQTCAVGAQALLALLQRHGLGLHAAIRGSADELGVAAARGVAAAVPSPGPLLLLVCSAPTSASVRHALAEGQRAAEPIVALPCSVPWATAQALLDGDRGAISHAKLPEADDFFKFASFALKSGLL
jgi:hypothetical protein